MIRQSAQGEPRELLQHITALDGIRGLAVLLVILFHILWSNNRTGNSVIDFIVQVRSTGWVGVDLFFTLSGFLITGILFDSLHDPNFFSNFYARRILRIFPLYYGVILTVFLCINIPHLAAWSENRLLLVLAVYLQNTPLYLAHELGGPVHRFTGHLWSLAVEEQFYFVWPFILFLVKDRRKLMVVATLLALTAPFSRALLLAHGTSFDETYRLTFCRADSLLAGAWLALCVRGPGRTKVLRFAPIVFWLSTIACCFIAWKTGNFDWEQNRTINIVGFSVVSLVSVSFIAMALRSSGVVARVMNLRFFRFLGKYSYGIYVFHIPIFEAVEVVTRQPIADHIHSRVLAHLVTLTCALAIIIPVAILSFNLYEKPFLKLKRYFNYAS